MKAVFGIGLFNVHLDTAIFAHFGMDNFSIIV